MDARLGIWIPLHQRRSERVRLRLAAFLEGNERSGVAVVVRDLSPHGFAVDLADALPVGTLVWLLLPGRTGLNARIARRDGNRHGCEFLVPIAETLCGRAPAAQDPLAA